MLVGLCTNLGEVTMGIHGARRLRISPLSTFLGVGVKTRDCVNGIGFSKLNFLVKFKTS